MSDSHPTSIYIGRPEIPAGLTIADYRRARYVRRRRLSLSRALRAGLPTRIDSPAMVQGGVR